MEYPLVISGEKQGTLSVEKEGLFTVFEAFCTVREELLKISVYGGGKEGYLGLMQPWSGGLYLRRKLTRSQLSGFPESIEYASVAGLSDTRSPGQPPESTEVTAENNDSQPESENEPESIEADELLWFRRSDGTLVSHDGESCIVALPSRLRFSPKQAVLREIDGQTYMLFRY